MARDRSILWKGWSTSFALALLACGASSGVNGTPAPQNITVTVSPPAVTLAPSAQASFTASVSGTLQQTVTWSVQEGAAGGTIGADGVYTAPGSTGTFHVIATSAASGEATGLATVTVSNAGPPQPGQWVNVTPAGLSLSQTSNPDNFGVQDVLADPARPPDFYAFTCYQGVWKSVDYGLTWAKVSNGTLYAGKHWTAAIDKNPSRNPSTPPTLWTTSWSAGSPMGVFKSTDGGVSWTHFALPSGTGQDGYALDVDPYDSNHLIIGFHEVVGLAESVNGGETWTKITIPDAAGKSIYPFFVDTGVAATARKTWITIPQPNGGVWGTWRTTDQGASWNRVHSNEHAHGNAQILTLPGGAVYMAGIYGTHGGVQDWGIYKSVDFGASWTYGNNGGKAQTGVVATATQLYASYAWAVGAAGLGDPGLQVALRGNDTLWSSVTAPSAMNNGAKRTAVAFDGAHYVLVSGNWNAGIWRYVEP